MEPLEGTRVPWAQGVGRSNRPAPTKSLVVFRGNFAEPRTCRRCRVGDCRIENVGVIQHRAREVATSTYNFDYSERTVGWALSLTQFPPFDSPLNESSCRPRWLYFAAKVLVDTIYRMLERSRKVRRPKNLFRQFLLV
jgi:hypothetical protein